ncbi:MAG: hypothetical protein K1X75_12180 [Leptospirales bacterium]|nr:hypothetical protein [Leptospirales bacterium]
MNDLSFGLYGALHLAALVFVVYNVLFRDRSLPTLHRIIWVVASIPLAIPAAILYVLIVKKGQWSS